MPEHTVRKPHGHVIISSADGRTSEQQTLSCCHCGAHWIVQPGSGTRRGFCLKCMGPTCGAPECGTCLPVEKFLEQVEKNAR